MCVDLDNLLQELDAGRWVSLQGTPLLLPHRLLPSGPGVIISSGGSTGGRRLCLQPCHHLDSSAEATATWLQNLGIDPQQTLVLNPLPMHHVSGLMPWWRSRSWGVPHCRLAPELMKQPWELLRYCRSLPNWSNREILLSLVPTQLRRLLADTNGQALLKDMRLIWIGGASLPQLLAEQARAEGILLAPCYGATETAAMVTALSPQRFLVGDRTCGTPLHDVELRLAVHGALEIKTARLAIGLWQQEKPDSLQPVADTNGWWRTADRAQIAKGLEICGRLDTALNSGGETIFPEQLEARLMSAIRQEELPVEAILLAGVDEPEWGQQLVAFVHSSDPALLKRIASLTTDWPAAEQPRRWVLCPELTQTDAGKWNRQHWQNWLERLDSA
ncbi:AMP-binding protein [Synechococcus sp. M16CYN]